MKKPKRKLQIGFVVKKPGQTEADFKREQEEVVARLKGESVNFTETTAEDLTEMKQIFNAMETEESAGGEKIPSIAKRLLKSFWN